MNNSMANYQEELDNSDWNKILISTLEPSYHSLGVVILNLRRKLHKQASNLSLDHTGSKIADI